MKMKRFLSLVLAMVMSLALAAPAFAAEDDPDEGIMPLAQLYSDNAISAESGTYFPRFTTTPGNGAYLRIWFRNTGTERVIVRLWDTSNPKNPVKSQAFDPGTPNDTFVYIIPTPDKPCTFYLEFTNNGPTGERITGQAAAAQYPTYPGN